jgi:SAM-dependent methyltransferase
MTHTATRPEQDDLRQLQSEVHALASLVPMNETGYLDAHVVFRHASTQQARMLDWIRSSLDVLSPTDPAVSVLSVGCGSGILDGHLIKSLSQRFDGVRYVGVDPNRAECDRFERTLVRDCPEASQIDVHPVAFEDFHTQRRFDLIHVIHTLYYLPDPAAAIRRAIQLLNPGGQLLILSADDDRFNALSRLFWQRLWQRTPWYSSEVRHFLQRSGLAYEVCRLPARLDVTDCFETGNDRGRLLLDFITQVDTAALPDVTQRLVRSYLRAIAKQHDGAAFVPHRVTAFRVASAASQLGLPSVPSSVQAAA